MDKLSERDRIGLFGFLFSCEVAGIHLLILVPSSTCGIDSNQELIYTQGVLKPDVFLAG